MQSVMTSCRSSFQPRGFKWLSLTETAERSELRALRLQASRNALSGSSAGRASTPFYSCLKKRDSELTAKFEAELAGDWPRDHNHTEKLGDALKLLGWCSEQMLQPPNLLRRGAQYAEELEKWARVVSRSNMLVINTDELSSRPQAIMDETFTFIGLPPVRISNQTRMCVSGKAGVMDVLNEFEGSVRIGSHTTRMDVPGVQVMPCEKGASMRQDPASGAEHYAIESRLLQRMRDYYEPYNQKLYSFLGRNLGW